MESGDGKVKESNPHKGQKENVALGCVSIFLTGIFIGVCCGLGYAGNQRVERDAAFRREAVQHGAAEWVVAGPDGQTEFRWKDSPKVEK